MPGHGPHLGDRLDAGRQHRARRRRDRPGLHRARRRGHRRLLRTGQQGREAGLRAVLPDAVRRPDPARGGPSRRGGRDRGRRHLLARRRQLDPARGPRRPVRARPDPPLRPDVVPARRRGAGLLRAGRRVAGPVEGRPTPTAHLAHRQDPAAAGAAARGHRGRRPPALAPGASRGPPRQLHRPRPGVARDPSAADARERDAALADRVGRHRRRRDLPQQHGDPAGRGRRGRPRQGARAGRLLPGRPARPLRGGLRGAPVLRAGGHDDRLGRRARHVVDDLRVRGLGRGVRAAPRGSGPRVAATSSSTSTAAARAGPPARPWPAEWVERLTTG